MLIERFTGGLFATNCYLVADEVQKVCCLIDASHDVGAQILTFLKEKDWDLQAIYLTHSHFDHFGSLKEIKDALGTKVFVHKEDRQNVIQPGTDGLPLVMPTEGVMPDEDLVEGQILKVGSIELKVIETPGHSPGSVSFYIEKEKIVINGDLIFRQGRGRTDLPGCCDDKMYQSMKRILELNEDVVIYSGHGELTTVKAERNQL